MSNDNLEDERLDPEAEVDALGVDEGAALDTEDRVDADGVEEREDDDEEELEADDEEGLSGEPLITEGADVELPLSGSHEELPSALPGEVTS
ncbi:MAG TPA: hypothetical protein VK139_05670 [Microbacteriaceae bacterium]|nr:hypothetical protein [Microbacteriaceae bacterium]